MHYLCLVAGENTEELLEPYDENLGVEPYEGEAVTEEDWERFERYYKEEYPEDTKGKSREELYEMYKDSWNENDWKKKDDGSWVEISNCNPNGQWDWYKDDNGRFDPFISKDGQECYSLLKKEIDFEKIREKEKNNYREFYHKVQDCLKKVLEVEDLKGAEIPENFNNFKLTVEEQSLFFFSSAEDIQEVIDLTVTEYLAKMEEEGRFEFNCYAYLDEEGWIDAYENKDFEKLLAEKLKNLDDNTRLTIVDCHN